MNETWSCHICGKIRDDEDIEILSYLLEGLPGAERNLRFCKDDKECREKANEKAKSRKI